MFLNWSIGLASPKKIIVNIYTIEIFQKTQEKHMSYRNISIYKFSYAHRAHDIVATSVFCWIYIAT